MRKVTGKTSIKTAERSAGKRAGKTSIKTAEPSAQSSIFDDGGWHWELHFDDEGWHWDLVFDD